MNFRFLLKITSIDTAPVIIAANKAIVANDRGNKRNPIRDITVAFTTKSYAFFSRLFIINPAVPFLLLSITFKFILRQQTYALGANEYN